MKKENIKFTCLICQKKGYNKKGKGRKRYYCSKKCQTKSMWERWEKRNPVVIIQKGVAKAVIVKRLKELLKTYGET